MSAAEGATIAPPYSPHREANRARQTGHHVDECALCGRGLTARASAAAWHVHMLTSGDLAPVGAEVDRVDDQGWFPVGADCARRVPATHRRRLL